ncbi:MAG: hypothetical protein ACEQSQ_11140, partial [Candidatus Paceibacteria bacterium]
IPVEIILQLYSFSLVVALLLIFLHLFFHFSYSNYIIILLYFIGGVINPIKFKKELSVSYLENYKLKQSKCPNNPRKKRYKKIVGSRNRRIQRDWIKNESWENEIPTHKLSKSILWEIV